MKFYTNIDLNKNQIMNFVNHKLGSAPSTPTEGQDYYDTGTHRKYTWNGTAWIANDAVGATITGDAIVTAINGSSSIVDLDNLPAGVGTAVTKTGFLTVTQAVDLDTMESNVATNNAKVSNATHTGDVTGSTALTIGANKVTNAMLSTVATNTIKGRITASTGNVEDLTPANVRTIITDSSNRFVTDTQITNFGTAYTNSHAQNTDTGTSSTAFTIGASGVKIKNNGGTELQIRNNADNAYADLRVNNLIVDGTTTNINSNDVNIGDSEILLNSDVATSATNSDGGVAIKRLMADNTTRKDAKIIFNNSTGKWETTFGDVTTTLITLPIANKAGATIGDGTTLNYVITHNLHTQDVIVSIREVASPYAVVYTDVEFTTVDTITVRFAVAPTTNQFRVVIIG